MTRENQNDTHAPKKRKVAASDAIRSTPKRAPRATKKARIRRRISSSEMTRSQPPPTPATQANQHREPAPTFYQPPPQVDPDEEDEDDEDIDEDEGAVFKRLERLSKSDQYVSIGKMFALKVWPWVSPSWWITGSEGASKTPHPQDPDAVQKNAFMVFVDIQMGVSSLEWRGSLFKSKVCFCTLSGFSNFEA